MSFFPIGNPYLIATWSILTLTWSWVVNNSFKYRKWCFRKRSNTWAKLGEKMQEECCTDIHSIMKGNLIWTGGKTNFKKKGRHQPPTAPHRPHTNNEDPTEIYSSNFEKCPPIRQVREIQIVRYLVSRMQTPCVCCIFRPRPLTNITPCVFVVWLALLLLLLFWVVSIVCDFVFICACDTWILYLLAIYWLFIVFIRCCI